MKKRLFKIWYRALLPDGSLWCESSDKQQVLDSQGVTMQKLTFQESKIFVKYIYGPWKELKNGY